MQVYYKILKYLKKLFNLYISDFLTTSTGIALYTDDSVIYSSTDKIEKVTENIQTHQNEIKK